MKQEIPITINRTTFGIETKHRLPVVLLCLHPINRTTFGIETSFVETSSASTARLLIEPLLELKLSNSMDNRSRLGFY